MSVTDEEFDRRLEGLGWVIVRRQSSENAQRPRINYIFFPPGVRDMPARSKRLAFTRDFRSGKVQPGEPGLYFNSRTAARMWMGVLPINNAAGQSGSGASARSTASVRKSSDVLGPRHKRYRTSAMRRRQENAAREERERDAMLISERCRILKSLHENVSLGLLPQSDVMIVPTESVFLTIRSNGKRLDDASADLSVANNSVGTARLYVKKSSMPNAGWGLFTASRIPKHTELVKLENFGDKICVEVNNTFDYEAQRNLEAREKRTREILASSESTEEEKQEAQALNAELAKTDRLLAQQKSKIMRQLNDACTRTLVKRWKQTATAWNAAVQRVVQQALSLGTMGEEFVDASNARSHPYAVKGGDSWISTVQRCYYDPFPRVWGFINDPGRDAGNVDTKVVGRGTAQEHVMFYTCREIKAHEELLWSYGSNYDWEQASAADNGTQNNDTSSDNTAAEGDADFLDAFLRDLGKGDDDQRSTSNASPFFDGDDTRLHLINDDGIDELIEENREKETKRLDKLNLDLGVFDGAENTDKADLADQFAVQLRL